MKTKGARTWRRGFQKNSLILRDFPLFLVLDFPLSVSVFEGAFVGKFFSCETGMANTWKIYFYFHKCHVCCRNLRFGSIISWFNIFPKQEKNIDIFFGLGWVVMLLKFFPFHFPIIFPELVWKNLKKESVGQFSVVFTTIQMWKIFGKSFFFCWKKKT